MSWLFLVLLSAFIWSIANLGDKFIEDQEIKDSILSSGIVDLINAVFFIIIPLLFISINNLFASFSWFSFLAGITYGTSRVFYFSGIEREEVSRFVPLLALIPVFVTIFSFLFLNETFSWVVYLGITLTIIGALLISLESPLYSLKKFQSKSALFFGVMAAIFLASKDILIKVTSGAIDYWGIIFWLGVGLLPISLILLFKELKSQKIDRINKKGAKNLIISGSLKALGSFLFTKAITLGPVALVSTVVKVKPVLVFIGSTVISKFHSEIIHEKLDTKTILQKTIATVIIVFGVVLIKLYS